MRYLLILAFLFPFLSHAQNDVKIGDKYIMKLDTAAWKKVKGTQGYKSSEIPNLNFSVIYTPPSPVQRGMKQETNSKEFLENALSTIKTSGYEGLITSKVKTYNGYSYYLFSYMEELNTVKTSAILAVNDNDTSLKISLGAKNIADDLFEREFMKVIDSVSKVK